MKRFFACFFLAALFLTGMAAGAAELEKLLDKRGELWEMSSDDVETMFPRTFSWMDEAKSRIRFNIVTSRPAKLTLYGVDLQEVLLDFKEGKIDQVSISVYNRGDAGNMESRRFNELQKLFEQKLTAYAELPDPPRRTSPTFAGARISALIWEHNALDIMLLWSSSARRTPEYLKVELSRPGSSSLRLRERFKTGVGSEQLSGNVQNDPNGDRYILLPMVDQGAKGYCVAATVERVMKYYGSEVDQHQIAQIAESDASRGTSILKVIDALDRGAGKLGIRCERYYQYEDLNSFDDFKKMLREYNSIARKLKKSKVEMQDYTFVINKVLYLDFGTLMKSLDIEVFRTIRQKERNDYQKFLAQIKENIDAGIPVCWSTFVLPGQKQTSGGSSEFGMHMRIISGYNTRTGDIIFTDSWGKGHEKKTVNAEDAWAITVSTLGVLPRNRRVVQK